MFNGKLVLLGPWSMHQNLTCIEYTTDVAVIKFTNNNTVIKTLVGDTWGHTGERYHIYWRSKAVAGFAISRPLTSQGHWCHRDFSWICGVGSRSGSFSKAGSGTVDSSRPVFTSWSLILNYLINLRSSPIRLVDVGWVLLDISMCQQIYQWNMPAKSPIFSSIFLRVRIFYCQNFLWSDLCKIGQILQKFIFIRIWPFLENPIYCSYN